jgi:hypothetical protein
MPLQLIRLAIAIMGKGMHGKAIPDAL